MKRWLKNSSLSIVLAMLFLLFLGGMSVAGHLNYNEEQFAHGQSKITDADYVVTGNFVDAPHSKTEG